MKSVAVIPARYASTRFPGKVLCNLNGKPLIQWVHERVSKSGVDEVLVATDDEKVMEAVRKFGGRPVMTSPSHPSGTDRVREAVLKAAPDCDIIVNVQGDEPLIPPEVINDLLSTMKSQPEIEMATVGVPVRRNEIADNPNIVKIVLDKSSFALYFSRSAIPFLRQGGEDMRLYKHWGIYAFRKNVLEKFVSLPESSLEKCEKLEQLRALENGIRIFVVESDFADSIGIDTPEDLEKARQILDGRR
jgi:3-deoxy-manno-octulosonate cytidylyltransferase (CMP-KDO synthetase)